MDHLLSGRSTIDGVQRQRHFDKFLVSLHSTSFSFASISESAVAPGVPGLLPPSLLPRENGHEGSPARRNRSANGKFTLAPLKSVVTPLRSKGRRR